MNRVRFKRSNRVVSETLADPSIGASVGASVGPSPRAEGAYMRVYKCACVGLVVACGCRWPWNKRLCLLKLYIYFVECYL